MPFVFILASVISSKNSCCELHFIACLVFHSILQWKHELKGFQAKKALFFYSQLQATFFVGWKSKAKECSDKRNSFEIICWYRANSYVTEDRLNCSISLVVIKRPQTTQQDHIFVQNTLKGLSCTVQKVTLGISSKDFKFQLDHLEISCCRQNSSFLSKRKGSFCYLKAT